MSDQGTQGARGRDIVLLSTADWTNPFWTNKQHVADQLEKLGHRVLYIDSLGLRRPSASARDLKRIAARIVKAIGAPKKARPNLWVWSPIILPWHGNVVIRAVNRFLIGTGLRVWMRILGLKRDLLWTYNPLTEEFIDISSFGKNVYHCVDEIKAQPGMPAAILESAEQKLARNVDVIFTTSHRLTETRAAWNRNTHYLSNVADYAHFHKALEASTRIPDDLARIPGPRLGFIGAISGYKIDFALIKRVAESHREWAVVLIGEVGEGDPWTNCDPLRELANVHFLGPKAYADLPSYLKGFDVALLPNQINEYTDSMFPMKFFEYLAAGRQVVSVKLKALADFREVAFISDTHSDFVANIETALAGGGVPVERRLEIAGRYTYESRTKRMLEIIGPGPHP